MKDIMTVSGVIISSTPIGEYDRRVVILTRELGKISCFARGGRRPTSKLIASGRSFIFANFNIYEGKSAYILHDIFIVKSFDEITRDYNALIYAYYFAEIAEYFGREGINATDSVNLLYVAFNSLLDEKLDNDTVKAAFEIRTLANEGILNDIPNRKNADKALINAFDKSAGDNVLNMFGFILNEPVRTEFIRLADKMMTASIDRKIKSRGLLMNGKWFSDENNRTK